MENIADTVAGGFGGLACVLAGQPFDTVKVKLQTYPQIYRTMMSTIAKTYWEEGARGFYAGSASAVFSNVGENAVLFVFYGHCQKLVQWMAGIQNPADMTVYHRACAGSLASVVSSVAITPPDRIKCRLQVYRRLVENTGQRSLHLQQSSWSMVNHIIREEGVLGLFRGLTSTWVREVPGYFFFFGGYDASRKLLTPRGGNYNDFSVWRMTLAGGIAGCCFWTAMFPADVVKSRIQVKGELSGSFWITVLRILRSEGFLALYKGLLPTVIRSFPANGALFVTYEYSRQFLINSLHHSVVD